MFAWVAWESSLYLSGSLWVVIRGLGSPKCPTWLVAEKFWGTGSPACNWNRINKGNHMEGFSCLKSSCYVTWQAGMGVVIWVQVAGKGSLGGSVHWENNKYWEGGRLQYVWVGWAHHHLGTGSVCLGVKFSITTVVWHNNFPCSEGIEGRS